MSSLLSDSIGPSLATLAKCWNQNLILPTFQLSSNIIKEAQSESSLEPGGQSEPVRRFCDSMLGLIGELVHTKSIGMMSRAHTFFLCKLINKNYSPSTELMNRRMSHFLPHVSLIRWALALVFGRVTTQHKIRPVLVGWFSGRPMLESSLGRPVRLFDINVDTVWFIEMTYPNQLMGNRRT